ncbi:MAG: RluA family pseudouridine synthase [Hyphomonas sp.]
MQETEFSVDAEDAGKRLDSFLSERSDSLSRSRAKTLVKEGAVACDGAVTLDPRKAVVEGQCYVLQVPTPIPAVPEPEDIPLDILFEDEHLIIVNKPAGMTVHPAPGSWTGTLVNALLHHCAGQLSGIGGVERPGIVHRIDKLTTGVMVSAKTEAAHNGLAALFASHDIDRVYRAITRGAPRPLSGTVDEHLARSKADRKKMAVMRNPEGAKARHAVTHYKGIETFGLRAKGTGEPAAALIECRLETGRTHQIRVHMSHIGAALIGDPVYGRSKGISAYGSGPSYDAAMAAARALPRQALHAAVLGFQHPITKEALRFEAPLPDDMSDLLTLLRKLPK